MGSDADRRGEKAGDAEAAERDRRLVAAARLGSEDAYRDLVLRYQRPIFGLVVRMVRSAELAEDLTQEVFVKAFRALDSYDDRRKLSSWLFKIAHNATIDHLRRSSLRTVPLEEPLSEGLDWSDRLADSSVGTPVEIHEREELGRVLEAAILGLKPAFREVMLLRHREELAYGEIAEITGMSLGAVKTNLHRGRQALAEILAAEGLDRSRREEGETR